MKKTRLDFPLPTSQDSNPPKRKIGPESSKNALKSHSDTKYKRNKKEF